MCMYVYIYTYIVLKCRCRILHFRQGVMRAVRASGMRIFLPNIPEVGVLRQRYPIMPGHQDGNTMWKEISALKDAIMEQGRYTNGPC